MIIGVLNMNGYCKKKQTLQNTVFIRPGRLLNFWTLRVGAYSRWALIRGWALIKFSLFSASEVCLFCNKTINAITKREEVTKQGFCKIL